MTKSEKVRENRLRRWAERLGLQLRKSRARAIRVDDLGYWMIVDPSIPSVVAGSKLDLSLDQVEEFLTKYEASIIEGRRNKQ
jgi:hypothetical protein